MQNNDFKVGNRFIRKRTVSLVDIFHENKIMQSVVSDRNFLRRLNTFCNFIRLIMIKVDVFRIFNVPMQTFPSSFPLEL